MAAALCLFSYLNVNSESAKVYDMLVHIYVHLQEPSSAALLCMLQGV